tara:strand:- start:282 stop:578 length:297 start_codon:yes stop_codon:yes gene_type:complete
MYQKAINVQAELMMDDDVSPKVRSDAANSLLTHLKAPETKMEIDVTIKQDSTLSDLRATTEKLVQQQHALLTSGKVDAKFIAQSDLIAGTEIEDAEYV